MSVWLMIEKILSQHLHTPFIIQQKHPLHGGDINQTYRIADATQRFVVKLNHSHYLSMFEAEFYALQHIAQSHTIHCPTPIAVDSNDEHSFIIMQYLDLGGRFNAIDFAEGMAALHRIHHDQYGWPHDNFIGNTPQSNQYHDDWLSFYRDERLKAQLKLAKNNGLSSSLIDAGEKLCSQLHHFLSHQPPASLLHGDCWSGNHATLNDGESAIYDPASYYGDRETDIAMTYLFGSLSKAFYQHYHAIYPLPDGHQQRKNIYNLYHILNHANLFGGGYSTQASHLIQQLLAEV